MTILKSVTKEITKKSLSALLIAIVFGKTSPKININNVITTVEYRTPFSLSPNKLIKKLVAIAVASVLTKLLPSKSVPINLSFLFFKKLTIMALKLFSFSN